MSDTPRTDKVCSDHALAWFGLTSHLDRAMDEANKLRELARQLERELAAAEAERDALRAKLDELPADWNDDSSLKTWFPLSAEILVRLQAERDALRALLAEVTEAKRRNWEQSPEGRAYLAKIDAALLASRGKP